MAKRVSSHPIKHIPQRTCVACRKIKTKQQLIRLARTSSESVEIDIGGKKAGRGAYLCPAQECWETALKGGRLEHTLRVTITPNSRDQLIEYGKSLLQGVD